MAAAVHWKSECVPDATLPTRDMNRLILCLSCLIMPSAGMADEPAPGAMVKAAVEKLQNAANYSWRITMTSGGESRFSPGPMEGKTIKNDCTLWSFSFGERSAEAWIKGDRIAVKTEEGWSRPEDCRPPPHDDRGEHGKSPRHKRSKAGFLINRVQSMKAPAEFCAELLGKISSFSNTGEAITATLTPEATSAMLAFGGPPREGKPEFTDPKGSVTWVIRDGALQRIELHLSAAFTVNGSAVPIDRSSTIEIRDTGKTTLMIPEEASKLLALPTDAEK